MFFQEQLKNAFKTWIHWKRKLGTAPVDRKTSRKAILATGEQLLEKHKKKSILYRIITDDEKGIHYDNPKRKKQEWRQVNIGTKKRHSRQEAYVVYLVGSAKYAVLRVAAAEWNCDSCDIKSK